MPSQKRKGPGKVDGVKLVTKTQKQAQKVNNRIDGNKCKSESVSKGAKCGEKIEKGYKFREIVEIIS